MNLKLLIRTESKAEPLKEFGGKISKSIEEVVSDNDVVITMLTDDNSVDAVMNSQEFLRQHKS